MGIILISGEEYDACFRLGEKSKKVSWRKKEADIERQLKGHIPTVIPLVL